MDDERIIHELLRRAFQDRTEWDIRCVESGESAMEIFIPGEYDLVVVDKNLGKGMDGVELVSQIRRHDKEVGICMITAYGSLENALEMMRLGVDGYLEKPFTNLAETGRRFGYIIQKSKKRREEAAVEAEVEAEEVVVDEAPGTYSVPPSMLDPSAQPLLLVVAADASEYACIRPRLDGVAKLEIAKSCRQALAASKGNPPDVVIVDGQIPAEEVESFVRQVIDSVVGVEVVVAAKGLSIDTVKRYIDLGVSAVLEIPIDMEQFDERVLKLLEHSR